MAKAGYHTILDPDCECYRIASSPDFIGMTPLTAWGKYFQSNVQAMMDKINEQAPGADLSPYCFEVDDGEEPVEATLPAVPDLRAISLWQDAEDARLLMEQARGEFMRRFELYLLYLQRSRGV